MIYPNTCEAVFLDRQNRFIAHVELGGETVTVHVKNTGRCRELLKPGIRVVLAAAAGDGRKTAYDLIGVYKDNAHLFNIDSQAPNQVAEEWLAGQGFRLVRREYTFGDSRFDFYMEKDRDRYLLEVKGCTLEIDGIGYFPDAPTLRGVKHLRGCRHGVPMRRGLCDPDGRREGGAAQSGNPPRIRHSPGRCEGRGRAGAAPALPGDGGQPFHSR